MAQRLISLLLLLAATIAFSQFDNPGFVGGLTVPAAASTTYVEKDSFSTSTEDYSVFNSASRKYFGTSFTAGSSYTLTRASIKLYKKANSPTMTITLYVYMDDGAGYPTNAALATSSTTVNAADTVSAPGQLHSWDFSGVTITSGTKYHLVMMASATSTTDYPGAYDGTSAGNQLSSDADGTAPFTQTAASRSMIFKTYSSE